MVLLRCLSVPAMAALVLSVSAEARAASHTCDRVEDDMVEIDGMLDDWEGSKPKRIGAGDSDHSVELYCSYDSTRAYLMMSVRDQRVVRANGARSQDMIKLKLWAPGNRGFTASLYPGSKTAKPKRVGVPKYVQVEDSLQPKGYSVEVAIDLDRLRGWGRTVPSLSADIRFVDSDKATGKAARTRRFFGRLYTPEARSNFWAFMKAAKLSPSDIKMDVLADVDAGEGAERIIAAKSVIGILGDGFSFFQMPVASAADVLSVKVINFTGDGAYQIVGHYRQRNSGGAREIVSIWNVGAGGQFQPALSFEVAKQAGANKLSTKWSFVLMKKYKRPDKKKHKKRRGYVVVIEAQDAVGWDEDNYRERPATDVKPIVLPWDEYTRKVYWFEGNSPTVGEPE